jgi:deoxyadenosine/deoxycytidine kinase
MSGSPVWWSLEGVIGVGKSTLLDKLVPELRKRHGIDTVVVVEEPVHLWLEHLERCSKDPKRYMYVAQTYFFHTRAMAFQAAYKANPQAKIFISERSPWSDFHVFWKANCDLYDLDPVEKEVYPQLWSTWLDLYPICPSKFIMLDLPVDRCQQRRRERDRSCERDAVTDRYQTMLLDNHWLMFHEMGVAPVVVDASENYRDDPEAANRLVDEIIAQCH